MNRSAYRVGQALGAWLVASYELAQARAELDAAQRAFDAGLALPPAQAQVDNATVLALKAGLLWEDYRVLARSDTVIARRG